MDNFNITSSEIRGSVKKDVPFLKGAWVEFWDDTTVGTMKKAQSLQDDSNIDTSLELLLSQIKSWNFADAEKILPINLESIEKLPVKLMTWLAQMQSEILAANQDKKKENSS